MKELIAIQSELKAPKGQFNSFGKYKYRSAEDILEAVKPLLAKQKCTLITSDEIILVGDRVYVRATVTLTNNEGAAISVTANAREAENKKGMDESQITGAASSYARKYAYNGMFAIDDTKDADTQDNREEILDEKTKKEIDAIADIEKLKLYFQSNKGKGKEFYAYVSKRKKELTTQSNEK